MPAGGDFNSSMKAPGMSMSRSSTASAGGMGGGGGNFGGGSAMSPSTSIGRGNLGITTGSTIHGNTAFGPAGGNAIGHATRDARSLAGAGIGPSTGTYSNFRTPSGAPMFGAGPGAPGGLGVNAGSGMRAFQIARLLAERARPRPAAGPGGLLDQDVPVNAVPEIPGIPPNLSFDYNYVYPKGWSYGNYMYNPTARASHGVGGRFYQQPGIDGTVLGGRGVTALNSISTRPSGDYRGGTGRSGGGFGGGAGGGW